MPKLRDKNRKRGLTSPTLRTTSTAGVYRLPLGNSRSLQHIPRTRWSQVYRPGEGLQAQRRLEKSEFGQKLSDHRSLGKYLF